MNNRFYLIILAKTFKSFTFAKFLKNLSILYNYFMSIISLGTMAFDAIETPFGKIDKIVGGSATYVAYAASHFIKARIQQISIVGNDFPEEEMDELKKRGVSLKAWK